MKPLGQLWAEAQTITQTAFRHADADVNGAERAKMRYEQLQPAERQALQTTVVDRFGETAWDDFMQALGGGNNGRR